MVIGLNSKAPTGLRIFLLATFLSMLTPAAMSQEVHVRARIDSTDILIGDWIRLQLEIEHPVDITVSWPAADSLGPFEIVRRDSPSTELSGEKVLERSVWTVTTFDSGIYTIPPLIFQYASSRDNTTRVAASSPITLHVRSLPVDRTQDIRDIKPPLSVPISFQEILPYLLVAVIIAGLGWFAYVYLKKRKMGESLLPPPPSRPPHEIALEALRQLEAERLWQRGKVKEYHTTLTDILRTYLEHRFALMAMEMTTEEILSTPEFADLERDVQETLKEVLIRADLVKFARFNPLPEENVASMKLTASFVERTIPQPETGKPDLVSEARA